MNEPTAIASLTPIHTITNNHATTIPTLTATSQTTAMITSSINCFKINIDIMTNIHIIHFNADLKKKKKKIFV